MSFAPDAVARLLAPGSIALVGATPASPWTRAYWDNLVGRGFPGPVRLVNPRRAEVLGQEAYASLRELPEKVDHVVVLTPAATVPAVLEDCVATGVKGVTVVGSGFQEQGSGGAALAQRVRELCLAHGIAMVGPNCFGFSHYNANVFATRNRFDGVAGPGNVGLVFQSGGLSLYTSNLAYAKGVRPSHAISSGNELVTDTNDYVEYFLGRDDCRVIGGSIEQIPQPERFASLAQQARDAGKPMVFLKLGRSAATRRLAASHTGSIAGDDVVADTFLRDLGVLRVDSVEELVETVGLLAAKGFPAGGRTLFTGFSGGVCGLGADLAQAAGIELAELPQDLAAEVCATTGLDRSAVGNPLDLTTEGMPHLGPVTKAAGLSGHYDVLVHAGEEPRSDEGAAVLGPMRDALVEAGRSTGVYNVLFTAADHAPNQYGREARDGSGAHYLHGQVGMRALAHAIRYGTWARRPIEVPTEWEVDRGLAAELLGASGPVTEPTGKRLLAAYGISIPREEVVATAQEAAAAAERIGGSVVVKVVSVDLPHKSDAGGVALGVVGADSACAAYERVLCNVRRQAPKATVQGVLVSEQITGAEEFLVGVSSDPDLGPVVVAGRGGVHVETFRDVVTLRPPFSVSRAIERLDDLAAAGILHGARGRPPLDVNALAEAMARVGQLAVDFATQIVALDVNPLFVRPNGGGVVAADALVVTRPADEVGGGRNDH